MPNVGDTQFKYGRVYVWVQPDANQGPGTWRVSNPDGIGGPGGTGDSTNIESFGIPPVDVDQTSTLSGDKVTVTTSLDFVQLDARDT